jgi:chemotaxis protein CheD
MDKFSSYFLYPSVIFVSKEPYCITTILGSCVAVCFWDPILKHGGMSHFMLPLWNGEGLASPRYGNIAIEKLFDKMISLGSKKVNIVAKVFGGGEVIDTETKYFQIGERNINIAKEILEEKRIPIVSSSVGGKYGRKIIMNTVTGKVKQRYIEREVKEFEND